MKKGLAFLLALAAAAGTASAASSVSVSGSAGAGVTNNPNATFSGVGTISQWNFTQSAGGVSISGTVIAGNSFNNSVNTQVLTLILTNLTFTVASGVTAPANVVVNIFQDYQMAGPVASAQGSHQLNGRYTTSANTTGFVRAESTHESTALPTLQETLFGGQNLAEINEGDGGFTSVTQAGLFYSINAIYTFNLTGPGQVFLPDSGVDNATIVLVPLPPAAFAGLGGLALVGLGASLRRRKLNQA